MYGVRLFAVTLFFLFSAVCSPMEAIGLGYSNGPFHLYRVLAYFSNSAKLLA
jgi:hypothetical protein